MNEFRDPQGIRWVVEDRQNQIFLRAMTAEGGEATGFPGAMLGFVVGAEFREAQQEHECSRGEAAHGKHQRKPATIGVGAVRADAAEHKGGE